MSLTSTEHGAVPDLVEEIVGFRAWRVDARRGAPRLLSPVRDTVWPARAWLSAMCGLAIDGVPHERCTCGIYAARHRSHLIELRHYHRGLHYPVAIGEVGLAGKVVVGDQGWRAAKARPIRLWLPYAHWELVRPLAQTYGIAVALSNTLLQEA